MSTTGKTQIISGHLVGDLHCDGYNIVGFNPSSSTKLIYVDAVNGPYTTLASAVAAASSGDEIVILSNLSDSGAVTVSIPITIDGSNHKITSAIQTDSQKLIISADGVQIRNIEFDGIWDGSSTTASSGPVIQVNNKRCSIRDVYIHDTINSGINITGNFSDTSVNRIKLNNVRLSAIFANSNNVTVNGADFGFIAMTNVGVKGLAVARGGAESNQVYGVNVHDVYYDTIGTSTPAEALYIHGLTDFHISNITGVANVYNISLDTCFNGTVENCVTRGGLGVTQYCGMEIAGCQKITVSNSIFDGLSRSGATSTGPISAGIIGSNLSQLLKAGEYTFSNVISINWVSGLAITLASGININGGIYSGTFSGVSFTACDTVLVTGADISAVGSDGFDSPIGVDGGAGGSNPGTGITNKDYRFIGNSLSASAGCNAEVALLSQDTHHQLSGITVKNNIKRDTQVISPAVSQTIGAGGAISDVVIFGNQPAAGWNNDAIDMGIITSQLNTFGIGADGNWNQITLNAAALGSAIMFKTSGAGTHQPVIASANDQLRFYAVGQTEQMRLQNGLAIGNTTDPGAGNLILNGSLRLSNTTATHGSGTGSPEGVRTAPVGSTYTRTDGGIGTTFYVKETGSGNTGWTAGVSTVGGGATIAVTTAVLKGDGSGNAVASTPTGTGDNVLATSPTLVNPTIGVATATSVNKWTLTAPSTAATLTAGADNLTYTMPDITSAIGFRNIPQNSQSASYTTVLSDSGKEIFHPASDAATRTFTIDSNANVAYPIGTVLLFTNMSAQVLTVAITADTMYLAGTGSTGSRAITQYGSMVARKIGTTSWYAIPVAGVT